MSQNVDLNGLLSFNGFFLNPHANHSIAEMNSYLANVMMANQFQQQVNMMHPSLHPCKLIPHNRKISRL